MYLRLLPLLLFLFFIVEFLFDICWNLFYPLLFFTVLSYTPSLYLFMLLTLLQSRVISTHLLSIVQVLSLTMQI